MMEVNPESLIPFIPRPNEYERLVSFILDQRFFLPVAITTSLPGARGLGKTTLARALCADPRVREAFGEGIFWVTLGMGLPPLELLSRIKDLIYNLTGKDAVLENLDEAEKQLHELLEPRRSLLIIDEADDPDMLRPFLQSGPGGACLLITNDDSHLPVGARRVHVDIMMPEEAIALLAAGVPRYAPGQEPEEQPEPKPSPEPDANQLLAELPSTDRTSLVDGETLARIEQAAGVPGTAPSELEGYPPEAVRLLESLADRLGEWPLLLSLANGMLRGCYDAGEAQCADLISALETVHKALERQHLVAGWRIDDPLARKRVLDNMLAACLEPFEPEFHERYLNLAVFPVEEEIPLAAVSVLWGLERDTARAACEQLARRALLEWSSSRETIRLHPALSTCLHDQLWAGQLASLNIRLVSAYREQCPGGWATGPDDGYYFQHLAWHLILAGRRDDLHGLLFDFDWLSAYLHCREYPGCRRADLFSLLGDYEIALSTSLDNQSAQLRLVEDALRMAAPALSEDPDHLAAQLLGRLLPFKEAEVQSLLRGASALQNRPWLRPLAACFTLPGGEEVRVLSGHGDWVTGVGLQPDGQHAVSSSLDGTLRVWNLANGQVMRVIEVSPADELTIGLSNTAAEPVAPPRATGQLTGTGALGKPRGTGPLSMPNSLAGPPREAQPGGISALVVTPDGQRAITAGWDGKVRIWNLTTGQEEREITAHIEAVGALAITPDGRRVISGSDDRLIRVWDVESGEKVHELVGHSDLVRALAVTPDGRTLVSGSWDHNLRLWDLESGSLLHILTGHEAWVQAVAVAPDGYNAISASWDRTLRVWDLWTGETVRELTGFQAPVFALEFSPDGKLLITGSGDGRVTLIDYPSGEIRRTLAGHTGGVNDLQLSRGGRFAVTAADDGTLRVWDLVAVQGGGLRPGHTGPVYALFNTQLENQEDAGVVSASWDGTLKVWQPAAGREIKCLKGHEGGVVAMALAADGRTALTGARDRTLKLWNLLEGREILDLPGHQHALTAVALTPDARMGVSGDDAGVIRVWDLAAGQLLAEFIGETSIWAVAITPNGETVTASESGGKMYFLQIER